MKRKKSSLVLALWLKNREKSELYLSAFRILTIFKDRVQKHSVRKTESWLGSILLNSQIIFQFLPTRTTVLCPLS